MAKIDDISNDNIARGFILNQDYYFCAAFLYDKLLTPYGYSTQIYSKKVRADCPEGFVCLELILEYKHSITAVALWTDEDSDLEDTQCGYSSIRSMRVWIGVNKELCSDKLNADTNNSVTRMYVNCKPIMKRALKVKIEVKFESGSTEDIVLRQVAVFKKRHLLPGCIPTTTTTTTTTTTPPTTTTTTPTTTTTTPPTTTTTIRVTTTTTDTPTTTPATTTTTDTSTTTNTSPTTTPTTTQPTTTTTPKPIIRKPTTPPESMATPKTTTTPPSAKPLLESNITNNLNTTYATSSSLTRFANNLLPIFMLVVILLLMIGLSIFTVSRKKQKVLKLNRNSPGPPEPSVNQIILMNPEIHEVYNNKPKSQQIQKNEKSEFKSIKVDSKLIPSSIPFSNKKRSNHDTPVITEKRSSDNKLNARLDRENVDDGNIANELWSTFNEAMQLIPEENHDKENKTTGKVKKSKKTTSGKDKGGSGIGKSAFSGLHSVQSDSLQGHLNDKRKQEYGNWFYNELMKYVNLVYKKPA